MSLSVKARIFFGFGVVLLTLVISAAISLFLVHRIDANFGEFRSALDRTSQAVDIDLITQKVRVRVNQWLRSKNPDFAAQADDLLKQAVDRVAKAAERAQTDQERKTVGDIDRALKAYIESWHVIQGLYVEEARFYADKIDAPGASISVSLAKLRNDEITQGAQPISALVSSARDSFMEARVLASHYQARFPKDDAARLAVEVSDALGSLDRAGRLTKDPLGVASLYSTGQAITAWQNAFGEAVKMGEARVARLNSWTKDEGEVMAVGANVLRLDGEAAASVSRMSVNSTLSRSVFTLYASMAITLALGVSLSIVLARSITGPLARMTEALKGLAAGDRTLEVPETGRHDEIGEMAKAAQVFKEVNETKSLFLASMSHEFRTPLNAIIGFAELLRLQVFGSISVRQDEYVGHIINSGHSLLRLIIDVLDFVKIETGTMDITLEAVNVVDTLNRVKTILGPVASHHRLCLAVEAGAISDDLCVDADPARLLQVLLSLGTNASKYNRPGGSVRISVSYEAPEILRITVADNGIGIAFSKQEHLFEPFNRLGAEAGSIEGAGIGLSLSKRIMQQMGGEIAFRSNPDWGSEFWISIPVSERPNIRKNRHDMALSGMENPGRLLLYVENTPSACWLMDNVVELIPNLDFLAAPTGKIGLELAVTHRPDLILSDVDLPDIDGTELLRRLRADPATKHIPVVALASDARPGHLGRSPETGFDDFLMKPFVVEELIGVIGRNLRGRSFRNEISGPSDGDRDLRGLASDRSDAIGGSETRDGDAIDCL